MVGPPQTRHPPGSRCPADARPQAPQIPQTDANRRTPMKEASAAHSLVVKGLRCMIMTRAGLARASSRCCQWRRRRQRCPFHSLPSRVPVAFTGGDSCGSFPAAAAAAAEPPGTSKASSGPSWEVVALPCRERRGGAPPAMPPPSHRQAYERQHQAAASFKPNAAARMRSGMPNGIHTAKVHTCRICADTMSKTPLRLSTKEAKRPPT